MKMVAPMPSDAPAAERRAAWPLWAAGLSYALICVACTPQGDPGIGSGYQDDFERSELGEQWNNTGGPYRIVNGQLKVSGARNKPLWLRRTLPHNVSVELDVTSDSPDGDIKLEIFGGGVCDAETTSYTATSYVVIFGGWKNSLNVLARMNEHGDDRVVGPAYKVVAGRTYHMKIERRGATIKAWADSQELGSMTDPEPLAGVGHDHFAINNWMVPLTFDNLRIRPL